MYIHYYNAFQVLHCYCNMQRWKFGAAFVSLCRREASRSFTIASLETVQNNSHFFSLNSHFFTLKHKCSDSVYLRVCVFVCFGFKPKFYPWESLDCKFPSRIRFNVISLMSSAHFWDQCFELCVDSSLQLRNYLLSLAGWVQKRKRTFKTKNEMQNFLVNRIYHVVEEANLLCGF